MSCLADAVKKGDQSEIADDLIISFHYYIIYYCNSVLYAFVFKCLY